MNWYPNAGSRWHSSRIRGPCRSMVRVVSRATAPKCQRYAGNSHDQPRTVTGPKGFDGDVPPVGQRGIHVDTAV